MDSPSGTKFKKINFSFFSFRDAGDAVSGFERSFDDGRDIFIRVSGSGSGLLLRQNL